MRARAFYIRFSGGVRALPQAPTLLGHLLWWYRYTHGREALETVLAGYQEGRVSLRLSSAFPRGWLPRPRLAPHLVAETKMRKRLKALRLLSFETFAQVVEKGEEALLEAPEVRGEAEPPFPKSSAG